MGEGFRRGNNSEVPFRMEEVFPARLPEVLDLDLMIVTEWTKNPRRSIHYEREIEVRFRDFPPQVMYNENDLRVNNELTKSDGISPIRKVFSLICHTLVLTQFR